MDIETVLEETVSTEDLKKFEQKYHLELKTGKVNNAGLFCSNSCLFQVSCDSQFEYSWCLVRSRYPADVRKGIILLEDLFQVSHPPSMEDLFQVCHPS